MGKLTVVVATNRSCGVGTFSVANDAPVTWSEFLRYFASTLGERAPVVLPLLLARWYAAGSSLADRIAGRPPVVITHIVKLLTTPKPLSNVRLKREIGFDLPYPSSRAGLKEVLCAVSHYGQDG